MTNVVSKPPKPSCGDLDRAHRLLTLGIDSINALATLYEKIQKNRGGGAPKTEEQDLLRAMVVMASAAVDATVKSIIKRALPELTHRNADAFKEAAKHIKRRLLSNIDRDGGDRLAEVLLSKRPRNVVLNFIIDDATGDSLQSVGELQRVANLLGIKDLPIGDTRDAFKARNQIVHELDAVDEQGNRHRRPRKKNDIYGFVRSLFAAATKLIEGVDKALSEADNGDERSP